MNVLQLTDIAIQAALSAGEIIQQYMHKEVTVEQKESGHSYAAQVVTAVDRACEASILTHLQPTCKDFELALLSEETEDDGSRFEKAFFWCIDPMDGTLPFIKKQAGFAVSIALVAHDGSPHIGVVFDPSTHTLYHAIKGHGVYKNNKIWHRPPINDYLTYVTDRSLKDTPQLAKVENYLQQVVAQFNWNGVREMAGGGSVINAIRVLENGPACMLKLPKKEKGGGCIWDFAATACIFQELGWPATDFEGGKLDLNKKEDPFMNHQGVLYTNFVDTVK